MILPGLVSVTFRSLSPAQVISVCRETELKGIEWGGDIHVPPTDLENANRVGELTREAGLEIVAYGSYYRAGEENAAHPIEAVIATAEVLGAPAIRIWPGRQASENLPAEQRARIVNDIVVAAAKARDRGLSITLEYHSMTLTDSTTSAKQLMSEIAGSGVRLHWQPPNGMPCEEALEGLKLLLPNVGNAHVFHWRREGGNNIRLPLEEGAERWEKYFEVLNDDQRRWAMLEFVKDDQPAQLFEDAVTLHRLLR